jgi:hypothetical protein
MKPTDLPGGDLIAGGLDDLRGGSRPFPYFWSPSVRRASGASAMPFPPPSTIRSGDCTPCSRVTAPRAIEYFARIEPDLYRFPALDPPSFRRAVEEAFGEP